MPRPGYYDLSTGIGASTSLRASTIDHLGNRTAAHLPSSLGGDWAGTSPTPEPPETLEQTAVRGGGTTADLVALAREIASGVRERFGVDLVPEPVFVGHSWDQANACSRDNRTDALRLGI